MKLIDRARPHILGSRFLPRGEVFDVPDDLAKRLLSRHDTLRVIGPSPESAEPVIFGNDRSRFGRLDLDLVTSSTDAVQTMPFNKGHGWWVWQGKKYRKTQLPAEALALLE